jgi:hypothetical protein
MALAAETRAALSDSTTWALAALVLGEKDGKSEILHSEPPFIRRLSGLTGLTLMCPGMRRVAQGVRTQ